MDKKILTLASILVVSMAVTGCNSSNSGTVTSTETGSSTTSGTASTSTTGSSGSTSSSTGASTSDGSGSTSGSNTTGGGNSGSTTGSSSSDSTSSGGAVSGSGGTASGNPSDCFNITLYSTGTTVDLVQKTVSSAGQLTTTSENTVKGMATFNGQSVLDIYSDVTATGSAPSKSTQNGYFTVDSANMIEHYHGSVINVTEPAVAAGKQTLTLTPPMEDRFELSANQSYTQSYKIKTDGSAAGFPYSMTSDHERTKRFVGIETVTVPAGTFNACRYEESTTTTAAGTTATETSTHWVSVGSGLEVKSVAGDSTTELQSAKINGSTVTGQ